MNNRHKITFIEKDGKCYVKKEYQDTELGRQNFASENLANDIFHERPWFTPWVDSGERWFITEKYPENTQLRHTYTKELLPFIMEVILDIYSENCAHRDFHIGNLFCVNGQVKVIDFETLTQYEKRPDFFNAYDLIGKGLFSPMGTGYMSYSKKCNMALGQFTKVPLQNALALLKNHLYARLCQENQFYSKLNTFKQRLPYLQIDCLGSFKTQRDIHKRLEEIGITDTTIDGKSIIDLGCNCGGFLFNFAKRNPLSLNGVEFHKNKVTLAKLIAAYSNTNIHFEQGDLENYHPCRQFDTVLCLAIVGHITNKARLYKMLFDITRETLYFEGNGNVKKESNEIALRNAGFKNITFRGYSSDDSFPRPIFVCRK